MAPRKKVNGSAFPSVDHSEKMTKDIDEIIWKNPMGLLKYDDHSHKTTMTKIRENLASAWQLGFVAGKND